MKKKKERAVDTFSLSFLDCICCGFGAIILLLVITKIYEPVRLDEEQVDQRTTSKVDREVERLECCKRTPDQGEKGCAGD